MEKGSLFHVDSDTVATCQRCGADLTEREVEVSLQSKERFSSRLFCFAHQRQFSACSAIRGTG